MGLYDIIVIEKKGEMPMQMVFKVVYDNGTKGIMIVAEGKGEARKKAQKRYGITDAVITVLGPAGKR